MVGRADALPGAWQGREIDSGPVTVTLREPGSGGVIDYDTGRVNVEFRVKIAFPELSEALTDMGAEADLTASVDAIIRSEGVVFDDRHRARRSKRPCAAACP